MRSAKFILLAAALVFSSLVLGQRESVPVQPSVLKARDLSDLSSAVPGMGDDLPGVNLVREGHGRLKFGDGTAYASRDLVDTAWQKLRSSTDTLLPGTGVHWLRFRLLPDSSLKGRTILLGLGGNEQMEIFLNGSPLFSSYAVADHGETIKSVPAPYVIPFTLRCDGRPEVIAIRLDSVDGRTARTFAHACTLHAADMAFRNQREMTQFGVFIGINGIILLLALVIWSFERRERQWIYLALLSLVSALDIFCDLTGNMGLLDPKGSASRIVAAVQLILVPWPMYLLIMTLGTLHGNVGRRRRKWHTISIITASVVCVIFAGGILYYGLDFTTGSSGITFTLEDPAIALVIAVLFLGLLLAAVIVWFIIEVIRLGIKLMRTPGYARWVGAGALASSVLAFILKTLGSVDLLGMGFSSFLETLGEYCSGVAVPVSVAVFLAIRTSHHGRLVARQRDELDLEVKERTAELSAEKERSDELLLNILPAEVAEELKATGAAKARHFDQVSVLFTDFKGFTGMAAQLGADALLRELNACFEAFDAIITRHGIEQIKTIGDAYMCAGGLSDPNTSSPTAVIHAALEMQDFMTGRKKAHDAQGLPGFQMRVGIHTGPVVAGIVGVKKFQYDIWGDTVNTASRMESSGEVDRVNISESTYELVKNEPGLSFTPRGKVQAKGKGELEMYFVDKPLSLAQ
ncbi:MAG: hypothetical protein KDC01_10555 [Flavobacteriales bacterium]|nr:hypothetical protein [Flavobacteriales bacterium]